ncbi:MAG: hypothetical protein AB7W28_05010 [Armatimonadota bacterium]
MAAGRCTRCGSAEIGTDGLCSLCGFPAKVANSVMTRAYIVTGSLALSVLVYAALAYFLVQSGAFSGPSVRLPQPVSYVLLGLGVLATLGGIVTARRGHLAETPQRVLAKLFRAGALCEVPAVLGFILALVTHDLRWLVMLTAFALIGFLSIAMEMPAYAQRVTEYLEAHPDYRRPKG